MLSKKGSVSLMNDTMSMEDYENNEGEATKLKSPEETHEEMVARHRDQLMDIFHIYNRYLFEQAE
jgi:hypothetical protein